MFICPHCSKPAFSNWQKFNASSTFPARCSSCGSLAFVSGWAHAISALILEVAFWGAIILAIFMRSWFGLLLLPVTIIVLSAAIGSIFPLKPIYPAAVSAARRSAAIQITLGALVLVTTFFIFGSA
jgi:hypothetical protein